PSSTTNKVEVPKEFPKVSMVNTSLKELKCHLSGFDQVVKERTTAIAITEKVKATLKSAWTEKDQIDNLLKERRLKRSLEKFVGGKLYEGDLRLR
ncbi:hypothetical protein Tco_1267223, partial [Tanacetum coccineum]